MARSAVMLMAGLLVGCGTLPYGPDTTSQLVATVFPGETVLCDSADVEVRTGYATARAEGCEWQGPRQASLMIRPEMKTDLDGQRINNSPWYGFRLVPKTDKIRTDETVTVRLNYEGGTHRYTPKLSGNGKTWTPMQPEHVEELSETSVDLTFDPLDKAVFISAQPIISAADHMMWIETIGQHDAAIVSVFGTSAEGRPLKQIEIRTEPDRNKPYIVLVGRQHPPEVTGAMALHAFTEAILNESDLSSRFLDEFNLLVIPLINPDGVERGYWRFNTGGMDLNRDWGPFSQPETQAVRQALDRFHRGDDDIALFIDFHSTFRNLLYTQTDSEPTRPPFFTRDWVEAVKTRVNEDTYPFTREPGRTSDRPVSKNYMYRTFGVPAITYEVGDDTHANALSDAATIFSEEMMRILLSHKG